MNGEEESASSALFFFAEGARGRRRQLPRQPRKEKPQGVKRTEARGSQPAPTPPSKLQGVKRTEARGSQPAETRARGVNKY